MKNKKYIILFILIFIFSLVYLKSQNDKSNNNHIEKNAYFNGSIEIPYSMNLLNADKMSPDSYPLKPTIDERNMFGAQIISKTDFTNLKDLYDTKNLLLIPKNEFFTFFDLNKSKKNTDVKYLLSGGADGNDIKLNYYLMQGFINNNGEFYQMLTTFKDSAKGDDIFVKGKFSSEEIKLIDSIYDRAYQKKSIENK